MTKHVAERAAQAVVDELVQWLRGRVAPGASLVADSRRVRPGDVFVATRGRASDGRRYVADALAAGAGAVLAEADDDAGADATAAPAVRREVRGLSSIVGELASAWYGQPSRRLAVVAVTGTNGKTSCTQWIARGFAQSGRRAAVVGTLGCGVVEGAADAPALEPFGLTTPDAAALQAMLARFVSAGVEVVALEASSIGIDQGRLDGLAVDTAVFTNLTRDHLDYHGDEQRYREAKLRLFARPELRAAVVAADDPASADFLAAVAPAVETVAFGQRAGDPACRAGRRLVARRIDEHGDRISLALDGDFGRGEADLQLVGRFNAANALAVAAVWLMHGMSFGEVLRRLAALRPIPGRMQQVRVPGAPLVVIDYAHTPDALASVLAALRPIAAARGGRLWCVFGAGGERDAGKRPLMGAAAERNADRLVLTSDNPRGEPPERIVADIRAGVSREPWGTELDRGRAIGRVLREAREADVVLIAGKGHETWQEIAGVRHRFSDLEAVQRVLGRTQAGAEDGHVRA